jgi:hypothetical protein
VQEAHRRKATRRGVGGVTRSSHHSTGRAARATSSQGAAKAREPKLSMSRSAYGARLLWRQRLPQRQQHLPRRLIGPVRQETQPAAAAMAATPAR